MPRTFLDYGPWIEVRSAAPDGLADAPFASIKDLYVRPNARCRGVGRKLVEAVEEQSRACGFSYAEI